MSLNHVRKGQTMATRNEYPDFDDFEITRDADGDWWLLGHGEYERGSVLEGQYRRAWLDSDTLEALQEKYPDVEVSQTSPLPSCMLPGVPDTLHGDY